MDHQPVEAEEDNAQGIDLALSGHTHAGQIWPVGHLSELGGVLNYGEYQEGDCKVIVSSGFTGWGYSVRTEGHCEYVVVNVNRNDFPPTAPPESDAPNSERTAFSYIALDFFV